MDGLGKLKNNLRNNSGRWEGEFIEKVDSVDHNEEYLFGEPYICDALVDT